MIKGIALLTLFYLSLAMPLKAQKISIDSIIGNWTLKSLSLDSKMIFDSENPQTIIDANFARLRRIKPNFTTNDSLTLLKNAKTLTEDSKGIFIQFNRDGTYTNAKIVGNARITGNVESGHYIFNELNQQIIQTDQAGQKIISDVSINNGLLGIKINDGRELIMIYKK